MERRRKGVNLMGWQILKQPNGKYAVWSTIVDNFIIKNCTRDQLVEFYICSQREMIENSIDEKLERIEKGIKLNLENTMEDCLRRIKIIHGKKEYDKLKKFMKDMEKNSS